MSILVAAFFIQFYFAGSNEPVGPSIYGGKNQIDCALYASDLIQRIKKGQGKDYRQIRFECAGRGK